SAGAAVDGVTCVLSVYAPPERPGGGRRLRGDGAVAYPWVTMALRVPALNWRPTTWAGWLPNGMGQVKPNHYWEMAKVAWANRGLLSFALRILSRGVCDGCALGTTGLHDFSFKCVHLCTVRLNLLRLNTM